LEKLIDSEEQPAEEVEETPAIIDRPANPPREVGRSNAGILRAILLILLAVVLIVLIVLFARWLYHKAHNNSQATQTGTNTTSQTSTSLPKQSASQPQSNSKTTPNSGSSSAPTNSNNNNLPNGGAGNVIAIFAGASLAAAGLHYIISLRHFSRS
jgi:cytoskeletal protein RodZ